MSGRDLHLFVDESKAKGYVIAIASIEASEVEVARRALRSLRLGGQTSLHFKRESARRRRKILATLASTGWGAHVVFSQHSRHDLARADCLSQLVDFASSVDAGQMTLELDASVERFDRRALFQLMAQRSPLQALLSNWWHAYKSPACGQQTLSHGVTHEVASGAFDLAHCSVSRLEKRGPGSPSVRTTAGPTSNQLLPAAAPVPTTRG